MTKDEFLSLVDLGERSGRTNGPAPRSTPDRAQHRPDLREDVDPDPVGLRGGGARPGGARHLPGSRGVPARAQGVHEGHRTGARAHVRRDRVPRLLPGRRRDPGRFAGVPVWNGLTDQWHPTQMLADILTMRDHAAKPLERVTYCYLGDARNNTANSLLVTGALLGHRRPHRRPRALWPSAEVQRHRRRAGAGRGPDHRHRGRGGGRATGPTSSTPTSGCRWANRSRNGTSGSTSSSPTRSTPRVWRRPATRSASSCTACPPCTTPRPRSAGRSSRSAG